MCGIFLLSAQCSTLLAQVHRDYSLTLYIRRLIVRDDVQFGRTVPVCFRSCCTSRKVIFSNIYRFLMTESDSGSTKAIPFVMIFLRCIIPHCVYVCKRGQLCYGLTSFPLLPFVMAINQLHVPSLQQISQSAVYMEFLHLSGTVTCDIPNARLNFSVTIRYVELGCLCSYVVSGLRREVDKSCALLGYYAANSGNSLRTFRDNLPVPSSTDVSGQPIGPIFKSRPLKTGPIGCPETSARNYHCSLRNGPEKCSTVDSSSL